MDLCREGRGQRYGPALAFLRSAEDNNYLLLLYRIVEQISKLSEKVPVDLCYRLVEFPHLLNILHFYQAGKLAVLKGVRRIFFI